MVASDLIVFDRGQYFFQQLDFGAKLNTITSETPAKSESKHFFQTEPLDAYRGLTENQDNAALKT